MSKSYAEPSIHDLLDDPLTQAVMQADGVDPLALRRMLGAVAVQVQNPARQPDYEPHWHGAAAQRSGVGQWMRAQLCGSC